MEDDSNETRQNLKYIEIINGSIIKTHLACETCLATFHIYDKNDQKTVFSTLKMHLNICRESREINQFGHLAKKSKIFKN